MSKVINMTMTQVLDLIETMRSVKQKQIGLFDVVMPNGKKFGDCTCEEIKEIGEEIDRLSRKTVKELHDEGDLAASRYLDLILDGLTRSPKQ